jgi:putative hemin transport protein
MTDTHQFFGLLRRVGAGHGQALALAAGRFTRPVAITAATPLLHAAAETGTPIMVFVGNPGCIQIHTGPVRRVAPMGAWINVLDADFNLHLDQSKVAAAWVVQKPTSDGIVSSLELLDAEGEPVVRFFGKRKPGQAEDPAWRALLAALPTATEAC